MEYYIGIDIGTSSAKLLLMDSSGAVTKQVSNKYNFLTPKPGWSEIQPATWYEAVESGMEKLLKNLPDVVLSAVAGIGVTGQMHTTVFLNGDGESIRPAIMWNDKRTMPLLDELRQQAAECQSTQYISKILSTGSPALNLYWLKKSEPDNFSQLKKFLIGPDYIVYRLTGNYSTDYCEASTSSLYDIKQHEWSREMRLFVGLAPEIYPEIKGSATAAGILQPELAAKWKLSNTVQVVVGTGDNPASAIACGCSNESDNAVLSLGTSGVVIFSRPKADLNLKGKQIEFSFHGDKRQFFVQGVIQLAGGSRKWWVDNIIGQECYYNMADVANRLRKNSVLFYPHLNGDKTLYNDSSLTGAFMGLTPETTYIDMEIAILEGICFGVRELIEEMGISRKKINPLQVTGGGAQNPVWLQLLADVLDVEIKQVTNNAGAAYGAAILAGIMHSNGKMSLPEQVFVNSYFSDRERVKLYNRKYMRYKKIHDAVKQVFTE